MKKVTKFISFSTPEEKINKLTKEIYSIEKYCEFMLSLNSDYNASALIERKIKCEKIIVKIKQNQR